MKRSFGSPRFYWGLLSLFSFTLLLSCTNFRAYYNTFFLAQKAFQAAEDSRQRSMAKEISPTTKKLYEEAITKASRILAFYPKSKYVDDALLMIGKAFYYQGEYSNAERKFQEVITGFPRGNLAGEANFFLGLTYSKIGRLSEASSVWQGILGNPKQKKFHKQALFSLAELDFDQKEYDEAITRFRLFLSRYKKDPQAAGVQMQIGESFWFKADYENAWKAYAGVKNYTKDREKVYRAEFKAGQTAYQLGKTAEGMAIYRRLAENTGYYTHLAEIKLELAQGLLASGQVDQALKLNQEVIEAYPKTVYAAQGYYQQGVIQQDYKEDLKAAKELFDKAKDEKGGSDYSKKALEKSADITKLEEYRKELTEGESLKVVDTQFQLAEFYLTHLNKPDSALAAYKGIVTNHPQSEFAPKALLAVAYICRTLAPDTAGCRQACEDLLKNYPATDYAEEAAKILNRSPQATDTLGAAQLFGPAEAELFSYQNLDSASALYQKIIDLYPGSVYVPRAMLGQAHILEHQHQITEDTALTDSTVFLAYRTILERFPESEAAGVAQLKLGLKERPPPKPDQQQSFPGDTTRHASDSLRSASAAGDTTDTLVQGLPRAPEPTNKAEILSKFIYPPQLIGERISGWVFLKIEIDYFTGETKKVELMERGGLHDEIDRRVLQAMQIARFDIQKLDPKNFSGIYGYRFRVQAPLSANQ